MKITDYTAEDFFSRSNLINYLIGLYGYKSYLEIGVNDGGNFEIVNAAYKVGVDPSDNYDKITYNMTSDDFFQLNTDTFDIIFIDGLHLSEQVIVDIQNSLDILNPKGTIIMHDCLPMIEAAQLRERLGHHWNGDVWKAFAHYRKNPSLIMFTVNTDQGLGVIKKGQQETIHIPNDLDYNFFKNNLKNLMNLMNIENSLSALKSLYKNGY